MSLADIVGSQQAYLLRKLRESTLPNHPYMSPLRAPDDVLRQFPTTYLIVSTRFVLLSLLKIILFIVGFCFDIFNKRKTTPEKLPPFQACHLDPLLDDSITFARHLRSLSIDHHLVMIQNLPHGFLNFYNANHYSKRTTDHLLYDLARKYNINQLFFSVKKRKKSSLITNPSIND